jgi:hypothetical protein
MTARAGSEQPGASSVVPSVRGLLIAALLASFVYMVVKSIHWPLLADAPVMRYINFMIDRGFAPYRDLPDLNMPGSYFSDRLAVFLFGPSDLGWRLYDIFLMVSATLGTIAIAWPADWLAGLFAGVLFALLHAADGPTIAGERDQVITVLLLAGYAFLFYSVRRARPGWMALLGFCLGMAATVKPTTAPLGFLLLAMVAVVLHRRRVRWLPYLLYGLLGAAAAGAIFFGFLLRHHSLGAFIEITRSVTVYYSGLGHASRVALLREMVPRPMRLLFPIGIALAVMNRKQWNWERWAIILGVAMGICSYFLQGKGFSHHRYELMAFSLLWFAIEFAIAVRRSGPARVLGLAGIAVGILWIVPTCLLQVRVATYANLFRFTTGADADLRGLGVDRLQGKVQCLDMTDGCLNALYRLRLVQNSGTLGDTMIFSSNNASPVVQHYRQLFWDHLQTDPPDAFLMSKELFLDPPTFDKVQRWPLFAQYLAEHYDLYCERRMDEKFAYRIYVRKGSFAGQPGCSAG